MSALFPDVPIAAGIPPVLRDAANDVVSAVNALTSDSFDLLGSLPTWGIFSADGGSVAIQPDSFGSIEYEKEWRVPTYPIEEGGFQSYNKVETPFDVRVVLYQAGTDSDREAFLSTLKSMLSSLDLFTVITPDDTFENANLVAVYYRRTKDEGAYIIGAELRFAEIRETATQQFSNAKSPSGVATTSNGPVQTSAATGSVGTPQ